MTENQNEQNNLADLEPSEGVKGGAKGTLVLTNNNTYTGQTTVLNGNLQIADLTSVAVDPS